MSKKEKKGGKSFELLPPEMLLIITEYSKNTGIIFVTKKMLCHVNQSKYFKKLIAQHKSFYFLPVNKKLKNYVEKNPLKRALLIEISNINHLGFLKDMFIKWSTLQKKSKHFSLEEVEIEFTCRYDQEKKFKKIKDFIEKLKELNINYKVIFYFRKLKPKLCNDDSCICQHGYVGTKCKYDENPTELEKNTNKMIDKYAKLLPKTMDCYAEYDESDESDSD